jgi:glycosyltransferase involved in cell wall biosynthesis
VTGRLRILHVVHKLDYGGLERLVGALVQLLPPERFESHILTLSDFGRFAEGLAGHAQLHQDRSLPHLSMIWPRRLTRTIHALAPDVVHTHSGVWYKASLAARRAGVLRLVHTDHGRPYPDSFKGRVLDGLAARRTDVVVAVSEALRRQMAETLVPRPSDIRVVINGIDTRRFQPRSVNGSLRAALGLPAGAPVIGSIGRLDAIKAYDVMLQAFARLRAGWSAARGAPPTLVLVGDGPERARLAALIEQLGLRDAARLAGWRKDVENIYPALDIFTLSSWSEGTSLGLLEAMSSGVCPVVTDVGGSAVALGEALRHRLVPPGNPAALAAAWGDALGDGARRTRDAAAGRRRVEQVFGVDVMVREYERIYSGG